MHTTDIAQHHFSSSASYLLSVLYYLILGRISWLNFLLLFVNTSQGHLERGNPNRGIASIRLACKQASGIFSWLMSNMGRLSPLWMVLPPSPWQVVLDCMKKKSSRVSHGEQTSKHHPSMASASAPAFMFLPQDSDLTILHGML